MCSGNAANTDNIASYDVALGTGRTDSTQITNVHEFVNVGLSTAWTFSGLSLKTTRPVYYVTVRAHSQSGAVAQVSSNGVRVSPPSNVTAGVVEVAECV